QVSRTRAQSPSTTLENPDHRGRGPPFTCLSTPARYDPSIVVAPRHAWPFLIILDVGLRGAVVGAGQWSGHSHSGRKRSPAARGCCALHSGRQSPHGSKILALSRGCSIPMVAYGSIV